MRLKGFARLATAVVAALSLGSLSTTQLVAASAATKTQNAASSSTQKTGLFRTPKAKALGARMFAERFPASRTLKEQMADLSDARARVAALDDAEQAARLVQRFDRLLGLIRILEANPVERSALIRQLPSAAAVLASPPQPSAPKTTLQTKHPALSEQPDGSGTMPASATRDLCEDEEGWDDCATDQELIDAAIFLADIEAEMLVAEAELQYYEEVLEDFCLQNPQECEPIMTLALQPPSAQASPATEDESVAEDGIDELDGDNSGVDSNRVESCSYSSDAAGTDWAECVEDVLVATLGFGFVIVETDDLGDILEAWVEHNLKPTRKKLLKALFRVSASWITATLLLAEVVECIMFTSPIPVAPAMALPAKPS